MPNLPAESNPLIAIDAILDEFGQLRGTGNGIAVSRLLKSLCDAVLRSQQIDASIWASDSVNGIFRPDLPRQAKRFVGVCLLRLLSSSDLPFEQSNFNTNAYRLFDVVFAEDLYSQRGLEPKHQTFQKAERLKDVVPGI